MGFFGVQQVPLNRKSLIFVRLRAVRYDHPGYCHIQLFTVACLRCPLSGPGEQLPTKMAKGQWKLPKAQIWRTFLAWSPQSKRLPDEKNIMFCCCGVWSLIVCDQGKAAFISNKCFNRNCTDAWAIELFQVVKGQLSAHYLSQNASMTMPSIILSSNSRISNQALRKKHNLTLDKVVYSGAARWWIT